MHQEGMCVNHTLITLDVLLLKALAGFKQSTLNLIIGKECNTATIGERYALKGVLVSQAQAALFSHPITKSHRSSTTTSIQHTCKAPEHQKPKASLWWGPLILSWSSRHVPATWPALNVTPPPRVYKNQMHFINLIIITKHFRQAGTPFLKKTHKLRVKEHHLSAVNTFYSVS